MQLTTPRLVLRDLRPEDWERMAEIEGDPIAVRWQSYPPRTADDCRRYLAADTAADPERSCFDLAVTEAGRMIGRIGLDVKRPEREVGELWFILERSRWRQGLMSDAARALVDHGFRDLGLRRVFLECDPRNGGSIGLATALGMTREGVLREHSRVKGEWCDSMFFGLLRHEWAQARVETAPGV